MYICIYVYMYIWYIHESVYLHPAPFACDAIFPYCVLVNVNHCCTRLVKRQD